MTFSHLSVHDFMTRLSKALRDDCIKLNSQKSDILSLDGLLAHSPLNFLRERPLIVIYYKAKPLGLYDKFCNYGGIGLSKCESYTLAKIIELEYKVRNIMNNSEVSKIMFQLLFPRSILPLSLSENYLLYDETRSKHMVNVNGTYSPSGKYDSLIDRLCMQAMVPITVPPGTIFENNYYHKIIFFCRSCYRTT